MLKSSSAARGGPGEIPGDWSIQPGTPHGLFFVLGDKNDLG